MTLPLVFVARNFVLAVLPVLALVSVVAAPGCSSSHPADVAGTYSGPVVNAASTCPGLWNTGQSSEVSLDIVQSGSSVSVRLTGVAALVLGAETGSSQFDGSIDENHVSALLIGKNSSTQNECKYTFNGQFSADVDGQVLTGTVVYSPQTNGSPDCTLVTGCSRQQTFTMTRPAPP